MKMLKELTKKYSYSIILLKQLVKTDFKLRYQGSVLGYLWSLLKPLFLFGILYVVFVVIVKVDYGVEHDGVYLLLGIVVWSFFAELTGASVTSIVQKGDLLRKLSFPKATIVLATALSALINFILNLGVVLVFMIFSGVEIGLSVLYVPLLFIELFVFSLGVGFFLSASFVKLRDMGYIWDVATQAMFYLTPILFPISLAPESAQKILMASPIAQIIQDLRYVMVSTQTDTIVNAYDGNIFSRLIPVCIVVLVAVFSWLYFKKQSVNFAEEI